MKNKDQCYYHGYKYHWDKLNHLISDSKKHYYTDFFNKNLDNKKTMWKQINKIAHNNNSKKDIIGIRNGDKIETDPVTIGNNFNNFSTTIA